MNLSFAGDAARPADAAADVAKSLTASRYIHGRISKFGGPVAQCMWGLVIEIVHS